MPDSGQDNKEVTMMEHPIDRNDLPVGFAMALGMNPAAMEVFSGLTDQQKHRVLDQVRTVSSEQEMQSFVNDLTTKTF